MRHHRPACVVLAGPSGAGKSRLAGPAAAPPTAGRSSGSTTSTATRTTRPCRAARSSGIVDWDHPDSWNRDAAVDALATLVDDGEVETPVYDISRSRAVDTHDGARRPHDLILAEGIFAAEIIADLRERGLLAGAYCVHHHRLVTFVWRLLRDLSEHRKPPWTLVRRGLALMRDEPRVVARQESLGAVSARAKDLEPLLSALAR